MLCVWFQQRCSWYTTLSPPVRDKENGTAWSVCWSRPLLCWTTGRSFLMPEDGLYAGKNWLPGNQLYHSSRVPHWLQSPAPWSQKSITLPLASWTSVYSIKMTKNVFHEDVHWVKKTAHVEMVEGNTGRGTKRKLGRTGRTNPSESVSCA